MAYVDANIIRAFAEADEASSLKVWEILAASASLIFDRAAGVAENFFAKAGNDPGEKEFLFEKTGFIKLPPFIETPIVKINDEVIEPEVYFIQDGFLIFPPYPAFYPYPVFESPALHKVVVSARWGFGDVPADVRQAVIEQAIFMWRRKDSAFTEISGVSTAVVQQQLSPTCQFVADKYREKYLELSV